MSTKEITPNKKIVEQCLDLISKPSIPVSRTFVDSILNKKKDPNLTKSISDSLTFLVITGELSKQWKAADCAVYFWPSGKDHDGFHPDVLDPYNYSILDASRPLVKRPVADRKFVERSKVATVSPPQGLDDQDQTDGNESSTDDEDLLDESVSDEDYDDTDTDTDTDQTDTKERTSEAGPPLDGSIDAFIKSYIANSGGIVFYAADVVAACVTNGLNPKLIKLRLGYAWRYGHVLRDIDKKRYLSPGSTFPVGFIPEVPEPRKKRKTKIKEQEQEEIEQSAPVVRDTIPAVLDKLENTERIHTHPNCESIEEVLTPRSISINRVTDSIAVAPTLVKSNIKDMAFGIGGGVGGSLYIFKTDGSIMILDTDAVNQIARLLPPARLLPRARLLPPLGSITHSTQHRSLWKRLFGVS